MKRIEFTMAMTITDESVAHHLAKMGPTDAPQHEIDAVMMNHVVAAGLVCAASILGQANQNGHFFAPGHCLSIQPAEMGEDGLPKANGNVVLLTMPTQIDTVN